MLKQVSTIVLATTLWLATGSFAEDQVAATSSGKAKPAATSAPYTVKDGTKVDDRTLQGWKTWRALACDRCHGPEQEGLVGPSLVQSLKTMSKEDFHKLMMAGRPEKGMPNFGGSQMVQQNWEGLYGYLKGRSDGQIQPGRLTPIAPASK